MLLCKPAFCGTGWFFPGCCAIKAFYGSVCFLIDKPAVKAVCLCCFDKLVCNWEISLCIFFQKFVQPFNFAAMGCLREEDGAEHRNAVFVCCVDDICTRCDDNAFPGRTAPVYKLVNVLPVRKYIGACRVDSMRCIAAGASIHNGKRGYLHILILRAVCCCHGLLVCPGCKCDAALIVNKVRVIVRAPCEQVFREPVWSLWLVCHWLVKGTFFGLKVF